MRHNWLRRLFGRESTAGIAREVVEKAALSALAVEAIESSQRAVESLQRSVRTTQETLDLVNRVQSDLAQAREELRAHRAIFEDSGAQVEELERVFSLSDPRGKAR